MARHEPCLAQDSRKSLNPMAQKVLLTQVVRKSCADTLTRAPPHAYPTHGSLLTIEANVNYAMDALPGCAAFLLFGTAPAVVAPASRKVSSMIFASIQHLLIVLARQKGTMTWSNPIATLRLGPDRPERSDATRLHPACR